MTIEEKYYQEYRRIIAYLESPEYRKQVRREFEKAVAECNLRFGMNHTPESFIQEFSHVSK